MKIVRLFDIHWDKNSEPPKERVIITNDNWKPEDAAVLLLKEFNCQAVMCSCEVLDKGQFGKIRDGGN
jgi:hypothetical protein